ncbi:MAG: hypothetical protein CVV49_15145 [Spirochaetae bacterium HGW-Spirochaetae-5]|nr:MAG: hypothetical protein CVV49_15145 [Spirochaetae bacterium HGW-Spirochaetae-5]
MIIIKYKSFLSIRQFFSLFLNFFMFLIKREFFKGSEHGISRYNPIQPQILPEKLNIDSMKKII